MLSKGPWLRKGLFSNIIYSRASSLRSMTPHLVTKAVRRQLSFGTGNGGGLCIITYIHTCCWECRSVSRYLITWFLKSLDFSFYRKQDSTLTSQTGVPSHFGGVVVFTAGLGQAQPWKVEPAASTAGVSSQMASAKALQAFLEGRERAVEGKEHTAATGFALCLIALVQQQMLRQPPCLRN